MAKDDLIGALQDQKAHALVCAMPPEKRANLSRLAPGLLAAVVRGSPELSGVSPSEHALMRNALIETAHSEELGGLREDFEALDFTLEAIRVAEQDMLKISGMSRDDVAAIERPILESKSAPAAPNPNSLDEMVADFRRRHGYA